jgi:membrane protease subunit HflC
MDHIDYIYIVLAIVFSAFILYNESHYRVTEDDQVVLTQFGKEVDKGRSVPGTYLKIPFVQKTFHFPKKPHPLENYQEIRTTGKKVIKLDTLALWRIDDPSKFFNSIHWLHAAEDIVWSQISRAEREVIRTIELSDLSLKPVDSAIENMECNPRVLRRIHEEAQSNLQKFGILLLNIEITVR